MKYTDCTEGEIYKCYFRDKDYWVVEFSTPCKDNYFKGRRVYIGKEDSTSGKSNGLYEFHTWKFDIPSDYDLNRFYENYPKLGGYEIY